MRKYANVYKKKTGTYQLRFTIDGKRYAVYGRSIEECRQKETEKRQKIAAGIITSNSTFSEYAEKWYKSRALAVKGATQCNYRHTLRAVAPYIGSKRLADLTPQDMRDLQAALAARLSPGTVNEHLLIVGFVLKSAVEDNILTKSPYTGIKRLKTSKCATHRALTRDETKRFLDAAKEDPYQYLYIFMLHTGCRLGEAVAIEDADIDGTTLKIARTQTRSATGIVHIGSTTKSPAGVRAVPLDEEAQEAIKNAQAVRDALAPGSPRIFVSPFGKMPHSASVNLCMKRTCEKARIDKISSHALRDTFATRCAESKMQPKVLMELLGHSDIETTMLYYVHVMDDVKKKELAAVSF